jgi:hypothetical protein
MPAFALLVKLSPKRLAMIEEDPSVVLELVEARDEEMPGIENLGEYWASLARMCGPKAAAAVTGEGGRKLDVDVGEGGWACVLPPDRVVALHGILPRHGDEDPELIDLLDAVRSLYEAAASAGHSMLVVVGSE